MRSLLLILLLSLGTAVTPPVLAAEGNGRIAITLISSFEPIPDTLVPADLGGRRVYRTGHAVFGRKIYYVRVGFFATAAEAEAERQRLLPRFPGAFVTEVGMDELRGIPGLLAPSPAISPAAPATAAVAAATAPPPSSQSFALTLYRASGKRPLPLAPLPVALASKRLYFQPHDGKVSSLNLGFFDSQAEAKRALAQMRSVYPKATIHAASPRERERSAQATIAFVPITPAPATPAPAPPAAAPLASVEQQAVELLEKAREALTLGNNRRALELLNQLLRLPPNEQSQDAQELAGVAHERNGERAEARREYVLYLKLYTEGEGADRVRQRLADLESAPAAVTSKSAKKKQVQAYMAYGSFSQYYYRGDTRVDTTTTIGTIIDKATLTSTDQSALITHIDLTGRQRSGDWDNRVVVRNSHTANFLEDSEDINRLYSAYTELRNKAGDYGGRLGRQSGNTGGLSARFDGLTAGYGLLPKWRVNVAAGKPVDFYPIESDKQFWGTSLDLGTFAEHWNGNVYYFQQTVDGISDRQAVGTEVRYFEPQRSLLLLTDYDLSYSALNVAMLQGTWQWNGKTTLNVLADHRRAPLLQTTNALIGESDTSIESQLLLHTEEELRAWAEDKTPTVNLYMLGVSHNISPAWQLGGDVKVYDISGTPATGSLPAMPATGNIVVYTLQGTATALFSKRDITVLSLSHVSSDSYDGMSAAIYNRSVLRERWTLDASLRYYQQADNLGADMQRITPMLRLGYRWRDSLTLEAEYGVERTTTESTTTSDVATSRFFMLGYRWDF